MRRVGSRMPASLPPGWSEKGHRLRCAYEFGDFVRAMGFLHEVAFVAEAKEHHPDFSVHWNRVDFTVWSHDVNRVTDRDRGLVAAIAKVARRHRAKVVR